MALPDYLKAAQGTAIVWGDAGGTGVTKTLTLNGLAAGSARMGVEVDLGALRDVEFTIIAEMESGTAPTAGLSIDVYVLSARASGAFAGGVTGADDAWPADGDEDQWRKQLGVPLITVNSTNDGNVVQRQEPEPYVSKLRFMTVVVDNNWDQAIRTQGTPADNLSRVIAVPRILSIED